MPIVPFSSGDVAAVLRANGLPGIFPIGLATDFSPIEIPDLGLWLRGDVAYTSISPDVQATNGQTVRRWPDLSGNARDFGQGTGGMKPLFAANAVNGQPGLFGDGFDDVVAAESGLGLLRNIDAATLFVVAKGSSGTVSSTQGEIFISTGGSSTSTRALLGRSGSNIYRASGRRTDADPASSNDAGSTDTSAYIHAGVFSYGTAILTQYLNGSLIGTNNPFLTAGNTSDTDSVGIGAFGTSIGTSVYPGWIAEVLLWPRALSSEERANVTAYLGRRYNIAVS
jgi:hypothetical protein